MLIPPSELQQTLASASPGDVIRLGEGDFRCKLLVTVPGLKLVGAGADRTRILWDDYARKEIEPGFAYNTFRTWTVAVCADGVTLSGLSIVNDAGSPEVKGQQVALSVCGDQFTMEDCALSSTQDTLFLGPLPHDLRERYDGFLPDLLRQAGPCRQLFRRCRVEGTVDFIFGCGEATFEDCELRSRPDVRGRGYIAAPAHGPEQARGFSFRRCRLTAADGVAPGSVWLARPWRDYGLCEFLDCAAEGDHIAPGGFDPWNDSGRERTARFYESPLPAGRVAWARTGPLDKGAGEV